MFAVLIQRFLQARRKPALPPVTALPFISAGQWILKMQREAEAKEARQYAEFNGVLAGAIVGAPADPEAFG